MPDAAWGQWRRLYVDEHAELRVLEIGKGGYSSCHFHETKSNFFHVAKGEVKLIYWVRDDEQLSLTCLPGGPPRSVPPEVLHQFQAVEDSLVYELSMAAPGKTMDADEIQRLKPPEVNDPKRD